MVYILIMEGKDLTKWRKQHGLTQKKLAQALGVDVMTISRWERGVRSIPPHMPLALEALEHRSKKGEGNGYGFTDGVPRMQEKE
jgi:transcriptional regulator with XRE-family HTH domain